MPTFGKPYQTKTSRNLKASLTIIRTHSEHLLAAFDRLSDQEMITLLTAIQSQTILLEHLLDFINPRITVSRLTPLAVEF